MDLPIQPLILPITQEKNIEIWVKREDLNHEIISGNKLRKLKYNLIEAKKLNHKQLLTFGGAFSNHIVATACAGYENGFQTVGVIRGNELGDNLEKTLAENPTLQQAHSFGMQFEFVTRTQYRDKYNEAFVQSLHKKYGDFYLVPEGGTNALAIKGAAEILTEISYQQYDYICSAMGTAGTISGLISASLPHQKVLGFSALNAVDFLEKTIESYTKNRNFELFIDNRFGGYARYTDELIEFINYIKQNCEIPFDPIYTGKMLFRLIELVKQDYFKPGTKILAIHTGGLQGNNGINLLQQKKQRTLLV